MRVIKIYKPDKKRKKRTKLVVVQHRKFIDKKIVYDWLSNSGIKDKDLNILLDNNDVLVFSSGNVTMITLYNTNDDNTIIVKIVNNQITLKIK